MSEGQSRQELVAGVIDIVVRLARDRHIDIAAAELDEQTNVRDFDLDSMDQVIIVNEVEDRWGVTVDDDVARGGETIGALVDAIETALAAK